MFMNIVAISYYNYKNKIQSQAKPSQAKPSQAKPSQAKPMVIFFQKVSQENSHKKSIKIIKMYVFRYLVCLSF